jgi:alpha-galactosidase/6-phospho-beta-glucosidase family protein
MANQNNNLNIMSKDELDERYINFCEKHDLDCTIPAEEQVYLTTPQQMWIDRHIAHINRATNAGHYMTAEQAEKEQAEQEQASAVVAPVEKKSRIERYKANLISMMNLVEVARNSSIPLCTSPSKAKKSQPSTTGEVQLALSF